MSSYYEKILATGEVKCIDEEVPFEIPKGWEWCRLRDIILGTNAGKSPNCEKRPKKSEEWGVLTTTSIQENAFLSNENKVLPKHYVITPEHCVRYGDILITRAGPVNRTGIVCMVENNCDKLILSDKTVRIDYMHDYCNPKFLVFVLNSSAIHELVMSATVGMAASQVNVSQGSIQNTLIPFPPSKEQQKIINKLEAILPQIEKYNNAQNKLDELNKTVKDLIKKSVLQEAIQGKLVSQLEEEGTAKELLGQIKAEKQRLVKDGKLKKSALNDSVIFKGDDNKYWEKNGKNVVCIDEEIPFEIPNNWNWCRLKDIGKTETGTTPSKLHPEYFGNYIPFLSPANIFGSKIISETQGLSNIGVQFGRVVPKNSILQVCIGGSIGKCAIVNKPTTFNQQINSITPYFCNVEFVHIVLQSEYFRLAIIDKATGTATPIINRGNWETLLFPLPPLKEQQRIIEKYKGVTSIMNR